MDQLRTVSLLDAPPSLVMAMAAYVPFRACPNMFCYNGAEPDMDNAELIEILPGVFVAGEIRARLCHVCHGSGHVFLFCPN